MKKKLLLIIMVFCLLSSSLSAAKFNDVVKIKMITTEHFDIIYNDESSLLASQINEICETTYTEICDIFEIKKGKRFPVIVSADMEQFNSYFQYSVPESIVIFDTVSTNDLFSVFGTNKMAQVFRHELTHALTMTKADSLFYKFFGFDLASINATLFQKEGVAVYVESNLGEGRLNDPLENSKLIEAKAEGKFPNYQEANVESELQKNGDAYLYGSTFYDYLIKTYGIEMFDDYYNKVVSFNLLFAFPEFAFNQTFPDNLDIVWDNFKNSIADIDVDDSLIIEELSDISNLELIDGGDDLYAINPTFSNVLKVSINKNEFDDIMDISSNTKDVNVNDGVITVSSINMPSNFTNPNTTFTTVIKAGIKKDYDISSFRNSIYLDDSIVGLKNEGEVEYLQWIDMDGNIVKNFYLPKNESVQRIGVDDDNNIVFTSRYLDNYFISRIKEDGRDIIKLDEGIEIQALSIHNNNVVLATIKKDELTKLTIVDFGNKTIKIMNETILGGVYYPVIFGDTMFFVRHYSGSQSLSKMDIKQLTFTTENIEIAHLDLIEKVEDVVVTIDGWEDYNGIEYFIKNIKPTLSDLLVEEIFVENALTINLTGVDPISMYSLNGSLTGEISEEEKALISKDLFSYSLNENLYYLQINSKFNWDEDLDYSAGFETQLGWGVQKDLKMNKTLEYGLNLDLDLSNDNYYSTYVYAQASNTDSDGDYETNFLNANKNKIGINALTNWSYFKYCGRNTLNKLSIDLGLSTSYYYYMSDRYYYDVSTSADKLSTNSRQDIAINGNLEVHFPYLIPGIDDEFITYDLPTTVKTIYNYNVLDSNISYLIDVNTTLFAFNIDGAFFQHIPIYYRTLDLELGYNMLGKVGFGSNNVGPMFRSPEMSVYANAYILLTTSSTTLASSSGAKIGAKLRYTINEDDPWSVGFLFDGEFF